MHIWTAFYCFQKHNRHIYSTSRCHGFTRLRKMIAIRLKPALEPQWQRLMWIRGLRCALSCSVPLCCRADGVHCETATLGISHPLIPGPFRHPAASYLPIFARRINSTDTKTSTQEKVLHHGYLQYRSPKSPIKLDLHVSLRSLNLRGG